MIKAVFNKPNTSTLSSKCGWKNDAFVLSKKGFYIFGTFFDLAIFVENFFVDRQNNTRCCRYQQNYFVEVVAENRHERCLFDNDVCHFWASNLAHFFSNLQSTIVTVVFFKNKHFWQNGFFVIHPLVQETAVLLSSAWNDENWVESCQRESGQKTNPVHNECAGSLWQKCSRKWTPQWSA